MEEIQNVLKLEKVEASSEIIKGETSGDKSQKVETCEINDEVPKESTTHTQNKKIRIQVW